MIGGAVVAACSLLLVVGAWLWHLRTKARLSQLEARDLARAYEREVLDAAERKRKLDEQQAQKQVAQVPSMTDEQLEREINK